jgi:anti-sigma factor RsiW
MGHDHFKKNLFALYDGELSDTQCREVSAHLEGCADCRQAYTNWKKIAKTFFRPPTPQSSEQFVQRVMERVEGLTESGWARWRPVSLRWLAPALGFGIAASLLFIGVTYQEPLISTESLLLASGPEGMTPEWVSLIESPQADTLLPIVLEGP